AEYLDEVKMAVLEALEAYIGRKGTIVGYGCDVQARNIIPITEESAWIISTILAASVILFSLKTQLGSVVERTKEIGILKAIGWTDSDITIQLMLESVLQGLAGGIIGVCIGYAFAFLFPSLNLISAEEFTLTISPLAISIGLAAALVGGALAGTLPALKAAKLQPAESLRRF
ncbi:MAG: FtsX-like permease family protein, partial [Candidatus Bathyarchaeota archaeon]